MKTTVRLLVGILLVALFMGCELTEQDFSQRKGDFPDDDLGALEIAFSGNALRAKTLRPPLGTMNISRYDIVVDIIEALRA